MKNINKKEIHSSWSDLFEDTLSFLIPETRDLWAAYDQFFRENPYLKSPHGFQSQAFLNMVQNKSFYMTAPTGTGKTLAYILPTFFMVKYQELLYEEREDPSALRHQAIILAPTKELCQQIFQEAKKLAHHFKLRVKKFVGGESSIQKECIKKGEFDILIALPDKMSQCEYDWNQCRYLIIDEADDCLRYSIESLKTIAEKLFKSFPFPKKHSSPCVSFFSATLPQTAHGHWKDFFPKLQFDLLGFEKANLLQTQIIPTHQVHITNVEKKWEILLKFLSENALKTKGLIFVNQKTQLEDYWQKLHENSLKKKKQILEHLYCLHGNMTSIERKNQLKKFSQDKVGFLLCTDVVARGMNWLDLDVVMNLDIPFEALYYIHRVGRLWRHQDIHSEDFKDKKIINIILPKDFPLIKRINEAQKKQAHLPLKDIKVVGLEKQLIEKAAGKKKINDKKKEAKDAVGLKKASLPRFKKMRKRT